MRINPFLSCSLTTDIFLDLIIFSTLEFNDILFFDIIHSILSTSKKRNSQSKWNSNFYLNIFSQWSNNGPRYHLCNLYRIRYSHVVSGKRGPATAKSRWRSSICWYQWKQSCRYSRSSSPISRLFFCLIPPPVSPPFTSSYHLWILSRIPPRVSSTRINLSAWTTDTQHSRSASIFPPICSRLGRGKLLLFTDSTFLPFLELEWRLWTATVVTRVVPLALSSCLFVLWEERYLQKYRLQECLCEIERRIRTKRGLRRLVSAKVDNSF